MSAKHTPGPYFASEDNESCKCHCNSGLAIIDTGRQTDFPIAHHVEWNNVPLLTAAPDLLEACRNFVAAVEGLELVQCNVGPTGCRAINIREMKAAIAKAEGRT